MGSLCFFSLYTHTHSYTHTCVYNNNNNNNTFILTPLLTESQRGETFTVHNVQKYKN